MKEVTNDMLFYCYSKKVARYIYDKSNGEIKPLTIAQNPKSKNLFSLFSKSERLQEILDQYAKEKEQQQNK